VSLAEFGRYRERPRHYLAENEIGSFLIGVDLDVCRPLFGPVVLLRCDPEQVTRDREHESAWFLEDLMGGEAS